MNWIIPSIASLLLLWLLYKLIEAKQFNRFKQFLFTEIKPQVEQAVAEELELNRNKLFPNNQHHIAACQYFYSQYAVRILQMALYYNILTEKTLKENRQWRFCQHLFHIEKNYLVNKKHK